jgi:hypothetical protein
MGDSKSQIETAISNVVSALAQLDAALWRACADGDLDFESTTTADNFKQAAISSLVHLEDTINDAFGEELDG